MYEISLPKRQIVLTDKREAILVIYEEILTECGIKIAEDSVGSIPLDAGEERKKGGAFLSFLGAPTSMTDLVAKRTRELKLFGAKLDPIAYALYEEYTNYMTSALRRCGVSAANIQKEEIDDSLILISELFTRFVIQALRSDASIQCKRSAFIIALARFADRLISENLLDSDRSEDFRVVLTRTHIKWIKSLQDIVSFVEELNKPEDIVTANLNYLKVVEQQLTRHLILELVGESKADQNWEGKLAFRCLGQTLERIEKRIVEHGEKILEKMSDDRVVTTSAVDLVEMGIMTVEQNRRQQQVRLIKKEQEPDVENFYQLLNKTRLIIRLVERISLLIKTSGWLPMVLNIIDLKAIDEVIQGHKITCEAIFERGKGNSEKILKTNFGKELGRYNISLAYKHLQKVDKLTELENKDLLERIKQFILGDIRELSSLGEALGCYIVTSPPNKLISDVPHSVTQSTPTKLIGNALPTLDDEEVQWLDNDVKKTKGGGASRKNTPLLHMKSKSRFGRISGTYSPQLLSSRSQSAVNTVNFDEASPQLSARSNPSSPAFLTPTHSNQSSTASEGAILSQAIPSTHPVGRAKDKKKDKKRKEKSDRRFTFADRGSARSEASLPKFSLSNQEDRDHHENHVFVEIDLSDEPSSVVKSKSDQKINDREKDEATFIGSEKSAKPPQELPKKIELNPQFMPPLDYMADFLTWVVSNNPTYQKEIEEINASRARSTKTDFPLRFAAMIRELDNNQTESNHFFMETLRIVRNFEQNHMDLTRPFWRDWLWDVRTLELYYLKYFCVDARDKGNDIFLVELIGILRDQSRVAFLSKYNYLPEGLVTLWESYRKVRVMAHLGGVQGQPQLTFIDKRREGRVLRKNDQRRTLKLSDIRDDDNSLVIGAENDQVVALHAKFQTLERNLEKQAQLTEHFEKEIGGLKITNEELTQKLSQNNKQINGFQQQLHRLNSENFSLMAQISKLKEKSAVDEETIRSLQVESEAKEQTIFNLQEKLTEITQKSVTSLSLSRTGSRNLKEKLLKPSKKKSHKEPKGDTHADPHSSDESLLITDSSEIDRSSPSEKPPPTLLYDSPLIGKDRRKTVPQSFGTEEKSISGNPFG